VLEPSRLEAQLLHLACLPFTRWLLANVR